MFIKLYQCFIRRCVQLRSHARVSSFLESNTMLVQSLYSPFFEFLIGVEIKREKRKCRITCMRTPETNQIQVIDKCACWCQTRSLIFATKRVQEH